MKVAGPLAGLGAILRNVTLFDASRTASRRTMALLESSLFYSTCKDLLIRRSWVRNPPGSYCRTTTYSAEPRDPCGPLAGKVAGLFAESARDRVPAHLQFGAATAGKCHNAHTQTGGMGRKADYTTIVPLCSSHHRRFDEHREPCDNEQVRQIIKAAAAQVECRWLAYHAAA